MADALLVCRDDPLHDLARITERGRERQPALVQLFAQRPPFEPLHDDVGHVAVLPELVDRDDVRMIERGRRLRFALKARDLRLVRRGRQQHLDGDATFQPGVFGEKHLAHAARANLLQDFVVCDTLADHQR